MPWAVLEMEQGEGRRMRTDVGRRRKRTRANTALAKPLWASSGDLMDHATSVKGRGSCGRFPFPRPLLYVLAIV